MRKIKQKPQVDYTPYHVRQQAWHMSILKFYREIELNDKLYFEFGKKLINNEIDQKTLSKLDKLRRDHAKKKKEEWERIKKNKATKLGLNFRNIYRQLKKN